MGEAAWLHCPHCRICIYLINNFGLLAQANLPGWRWAGIKQLALVGSSSSLHSEACKALGGSDGVIHSRISDSGDCVRAGANFLLEVPLEREYTGWWDNSPYITRMRITKTLCVPNFHTRTGG